MTSHVSRRAIATLSIGGLMAGLTTWSLATAPVASAAIEVHSASVDLASLPSSHPLELSQFDATLGTLTTLTVIATLEGNIDATVWNLTDAPALTTVTFDSSSDAVGPGGIDLHVSIDDSSSDVLAPDSPKTFNLNAAGDQTEVITAPADLAAFIGTGNVVFDVSGLVDTNVFGPAAWRTRGVANAVATVTVEYDYTTESTTTTSSTSSTSTTLPTTTTEPTTTTSPTTTEPPTTSTTSTTSTTTSTSTTTEPATTTEPPTTTTEPPVCETLKVHDGNFDVVPGSYFEGRITVTSVSADGTSADWTSVDSVMWIVVNTQDLSVHHYEYPAGSTGGTIVSPDGAELMWFYVQICG